MLNVEDAGRCWKSDTIEFVIVEGSITWKVLEG